MDPISCLMMHCVPYLGERAIFRILQSSIQEGAALENFFRQSQDAYEQKYGLRRRSVDYLFHGRHLIHQQALQLFEELGLRDIKILTPWDTDYPERFLSTLEIPPPLLYLRGDETLLSRPTAAVVGSTGISPEGLSYALAAARTLIAAGYTLVTSRYRSVYNLSYQAGLESARPVIVVWDRGILAERADSQWSPKSSDLELSVFRPHDAWIGHKSARRDQLIFALSDVVVAVELRPGGKIDRESRRFLRLGRRVLTATERGSDSSLRHLLNAGAEPFDPTDLPGSLLGVLGGPKDRIKSSSRKL
ncbi:MAG: DNA-processing protein DprA [Deltaproteobacteria bacterium]|nr:DNA-processing protein DprA [Deltaproteobacteria bacterium]MBW2307548.1 DNA-processing protein DprA [Deltaproteobacteria bacterium]